MDNYMAIYKVKDIELTYHMVVVCPTSCFATE
jgi:hypothetical protein